MVDANSGRRLDVNAAFLKDIKDDNRHLKQLLDQIAPMMKHPNVAENHWRELIELLEELRDQLAFHFSLEEAYGYFDAALESEPQRSAEAEVLRGEHSGLFAKIRDLTDRAGDVAPESTRDVEGFLHDYSEFFHAFARHEEAELRLILSTLDDDIGVCD